MRSIRLLLLASILSAVALVLASPSARAEVRVFTCEPEWAALAEEIGGRLVRNNFV